MAALDADMIESVTGVMTQQMSINSANPGPTNQIAVTATAETELDPIYKDLRKQLYLDRVFSTYGAITYAYLGDVEAPHQFTFEIGDFRNADAPQPTEA